MSLPKLDTIVNVATLLACAAVGVATYRAVGGKPAPNRPPRPHVETVTGIITTLPERARRRGTGKVALIEFSDFECPFCGRFAHDNWSRLKRDFIDNGHVTYAVREMPLLGTHPHAGRAAVASVCAARFDKYWPMYESLFAHQNALTDTDLRSYAIGTGIDGGRFGECVADRKSTDEVLKDRSEAMRLRIASTPTFVVGALGADGHTVTLLRRINGSIPYDEMKAAVNEVIRAVK